MERVQHTPIPTVPAAEAQQLRLGTAENGRTTVIPMLIPTIFGGTAGDTNPAQD